jgi:hypothetical protein
MEKKKKLKSQEVFSSPDTNPELNTDLEEKNEVVTEDDLDLIFDVTSDSDISNDDNFYDIEND